MEYAPSPTSLELAALADELSPRATIRHVRRIEGGLGCTIDELVISDGSTSPTRVILRRKTGKHEHLLAREYLVLKFLRDSGIAVPEPLWIDESDIFGESAIVISFIDGEVLLDPDDPLDWADQIALAMASLHAVVPGPELLAQLPDINSRETERISSAEPSPEIMGHPLGARIWRRHREEFERTEFGPAVFAHGDFWPGNSLWRDQQFIAFIDLEEAEMADPALDVAVCAGDMRLGGQLVAADRFIKTYKAETGRSLDSIGYWALNYLEYPMPDIARWFPSFQINSSIPGITVDGLRARHTRMVEEALC